MKRLLDRKSVEAHHCDPVSPVRLSKHCHKKIELVLRLVHDLVSW